MAEIKYTKNELRLQQVKLKQLEKYLPTLQLKKAMLQVEVVEARNEIVACKASYQQFYNQVEQDSALLATFLPINLQDSIKVSKVIKRYENIAGIEVPYFETIEFADFSYSLFDTPVWIDAMIVKLRKLKEAHARMCVAEQKKEILEKELSEVSIRVNLFEKILIPRALANIKKIKVFLGDLQLAAVSQAKVAKTKIEQRKESLILG